MADHPSDVELKPFTAEEEIKMGNLLTNYCEGEKKSARSLTTMQTSCHRVEIASESLRALDLDAPQADIDENTPPEPIRTRNQSRQHVKTKKDPTRSSKKGKRNRPPASDTPPHIPIKVPRVSSTPIRQAMEIPSPEVASGSRTANPPSPPKPSTPPELSWYGGLSESERDLADNFATTRSLLMLEDLIEAHNESVGRLSTLIQSKEDEIEEYLSKSTSPSLETRARTAIPNECWDLQELRNKFQAGALRTRLNPIPYQKPGVDLPDCQPKKEDTGTFEDFKKISIRKNIGTKLTKVRCGDIRGFTEYVYESLRRDLLMKTVLKDENRRNGNSYLVIVSEICRVHKQFKPEDFGIDSSYLSRMILHI
ncbi:TPA_asm: hypothetical protein [Sphaeridiorhabdovirus 3]|nr:TPA_asm: hypothetical protein [Sphaeridiorhabdovirus 3]